jgi:hypothetical protein
VAKRAQIVLAEKQGVYLQVTPDSKVVLANFARFAKRKRCHLLTSDQCERLASPMGEA